MPRYFFHQADRGRELDQDGVELPDDAAARHQAVLYASEILRDAPDLLWEAGQWRVEVTDEAGRLCWAVIMLAIDTPTRREGDDPAETLPDLLVPAARH